MKTYRVLLNPKAADELRELSPEAAARIREGLKNLATDPTRPRSGLDVKLLSGTSNPKLYRLRVGGYRAIFWVDGEKGEVLVERVAARRRAYAGI